MQTKSAECPRSRRTGLVCACVLSAAVALAGSSAQAAEALHVGLSPDWEGFVLWYAREQGCDAARGVQFVPERLAGGVNPVSSDSAGQAWDISYTPAVAALSAPAEAGLEVIAIGRRHYSCALVLRALSQVSETRGWNAALPEVYGTPETVRDSAYLISGGLTPNFLLQAWLRSFGMGIRDIRLKTLSSDAEVRQALAAQGAPQTVQAQPAQKSRTAEGAVLCDQYLPAPAGYVVAADFAALGLDMPVVFISRRGFAAAHTEAASAFIGAYLDALAAVRRLDGAALQKACTAFLSQFPAAAVTAAALAGRIRESQPASIEAQSKALAPAGAVREALGGLARELLLNGDHPYRRMRPLLLALPVSDSYLKTLAAAPRRAQ